MRPNANDKYYVIEGDNDNAWYYQDDAENHHIKTCPEEHPNKAVSYRRLENVILYVPYEDLTGRQKHKICVQHAKYINARPTIKVNTMSEFDRFNEAYELGYLNGSDGEDRINPYDPDSEKSMYYEYNRGYRVGHLLANMR